MTPAHLFTLESPLGPLHLALVAGRLVALTFTPQERARILQRHGITAGATQDPARREVEARLGAYFAGELAALEPLPVALAGTPFQRAVWQALRAIPPGTTESYGHLAARLGRPRACRAVGQAVGANPVSLVLPCHRVVGRAGGLVGFGGGLARKRWLLAHEGVLDPADSTVLRVDQSLEGAADVAFVGGQQGARPRRLEPVEDQQRRRHLAACGSKRPFHRRG